VPVKRGMSIPDVAVMPSRPKYERQLAYTHKHPYYPAAHPTTKKQKPCESVMEAVKANIAGGIEDTFFVADLGALKRQHHKWSRLLPRVVRSILQLWYEAIASSHNQVVMIVYNCIHPIPQGSYYAVKCNTDPELLKTLVSLCDGFDCASLREIQTMLELGVPPTNIIYANPCKAPAHIRYARDHGIHVMTFDNPGELSKIKAINPNAKMVLRILTDDSHSNCPFGVKFGAHPNVTLSLLETAKELGLEVVGVSFHVGSGCMDPLAYDDAIRRAHKVFAQGHSLGFNMTLLDVGGGFPGTEKEEMTSINLEGFAPILNKALDTYFPPESNIKVIAEPGRYFAAPVFTLVTNIISLRVTAGSGGGDGDDKTSIMYYMNEGVYGSFNCTVFDPLAPLKPQVLTCGGKLVCSSQVGR